ncbi:ABC transporter ATP-binding protein [Rhodanobacter glycinis]|uniref:ABC transporter ATP-binding protein n=1 Tax=Rhodanobacter glycinis TaxID=582702 RepID=A0A502CDJ3_9GAMM|nr:ABC transporter ATP-binding protein [Rhodanobacter glycinis]TPG09791.1 ABC transporter ATP-binding protein [Rhodanobacter glycinis]TPG46696.1 ABC transporter ATP-binding protein [Rhodanobacter glycinis]
MRDEGESPRETAAPEPAPPSSGLLTEIGQLGRAVKHLFGAQMHLLAAELGLARSAVSWMLLAGLAATVAGVGFGLTVLGLLGVVLAAWFGSWIWSLLVLALLQMLFLVGSILLFRRCMHWMSLPVTRNEWSEMMRDTLHKAETEIEAEAGNRQGNREGDRS